MKTLTIMISTFAIALTLQAGLAAAQPKAGAPKYQTIKIRMEQPAFPGASPVG